MRHFDGTLRTVIWVGAVLGSAMALSLAPSQAAAEQAGTPALVPSQWQPLHDRWSALLADLKLAGMAVAAVQDDRVVLVDALGIREPVGRAPVVPDSPFYIASSTKSFTAMAVAILVDEGKLQLDDPVQRYLPRLQLADPAVSESITVRDLLAHRRGIDSTPISTCEAFTGLIDDDRYYRLLARVKSKPKFQYSNLNFTLAGRLIEAVSGQHWKQFIAQRILEPSGMRHSYCQASQLYGDPAAALPTEEIAGRLAVARTRKVDATMHAAGGMGCSAADLARWLRLNLNLGTIDGTRILSEEMARTMQSPQVQVSEASLSSSGFESDAYGLGFLLGKHRGRRLVHHAGGYTGARCHVSMMPDERIGVVVVVNMLGPAPGLAEVVAADVYEKLLDLPPEDRHGPLRTQVERSRSRAASRSTAEPVAITAEGGLSRPIGAYVGRYSNPDYGDLLVEQHEGQLVFRLGAHRPLVSSTGPDRFQGDLLPGGARPNEFEVDGDGRVTAVTIRDSFQLTRFERQ